MPQVIINFGGTFVPAKRKTSDAHRARENSFATRETKVYQNTTTKAVPRCGTNYTVNSTWMAGQ